MLIFNVISIIGVAVIFLLLSRFSQKVHLLYPGFYLFGKSELLRSVNGDFQIIVPRIIFAQNYNCMAKLENRKKQNPKLRQ